MSKTKFKDNCFRCAKAWNCYTRDNCQFEEMPLDNAFDGFDDDKEKPFENIDIDGNVIETDFNHAFNEGFVDGDISPIPDYSNECHDLL